MDQPYTPIACSDHDELLALATLRRQMTSTILDAGGNPLTLTGVIEDVYTRTGAEYMRMRDGTTVRLDQIVLLNGQAFGQDVCHIS